MHILKNGRFCYRKTEGYEEDDESELSSFVLHFRESKYSCWLAARTWARMSASALE